MRDWIFLKPVSLRPTRLAGGKADAFTALFDGRDQIRQERRIVLPVAIKRRHDGAARGANAAAHRRRLAGRSRVTDLAQIGARFIMAQQAARRVASVEPSLT